MVRTCEAKASTARELNVAPFSSEYQKLLPGSSMTKFTTKLAYSTRNQVMPAHTIPQLSWMNHMVRFPPAWPAWTPPTIAPAARLPVSTSAPADSSGWCCSVSRSRWFEDCILPCGLGEIFQARLRGRLGLLTIKLEDKKHAVFNSGYFVGMVTYNNIK